MSESAPAVSVVVAMLDEEATIESLVRRVCAVLEKRGVSFELLLVDDGSSDRTVDLARRLEAEDERIRVFELTRNFGQVNALACGIFAARGDVVVTMDGDLQNPPEEIPRLLDALRRPGEIATGKRSVRYEGTLRWIGSRFMHYLAVILTGAQIEDFGGNFRAYGREAVEGLRQLWTTGRPLLPLALWAGYTPVEVPVEHAPPFRGRSRYSLFKLVQINLELLTGLTTVPLALMGLVGILLLMAGTASLLLRLPPSADDWIAVAVALAACVAGSVFLAAGLLGLYIGRIYWLTTGRGPAFLVRRGPVRP